jgi:serine protease inhibitor
MRILTVLSLLLLLSLLVLQCSERATQSNSPDPQPNRPVYRTTAELTAQEISLLTSANKFGLNLFKEIVARTPETENIFISPLSVSYALGMCYNGANGDTREAIGLTLQMADLPLEEMNQAYHDLTQILVNADSLIDFRVANSFWSRQGKAIQPRFIDLARTFFDARVEEIDFQTPWAADTINSWVDRSTNGKITDMVKPPIDPTVIAMIFNAIYFKGNWMFPFDTANTRTNTFHLADGSGTECDMMFLDQDECWMQLPDTLYPQTDSNIILYQDHEVFVLSMPYGKGDFRMSIVVPNRWFDYPLNTSATIEDVIESMTPEKWDMWTSGDTPYRFELKLPRFKFEYEVKLNDVLKILGMEIAFSPGADLSNMFVDGGGWIDEAKHKTFIQVDEKGTEAAAVTQITIIRSAPPSVICDRPFLIVIHEDVSGAILFMGRIANPIWED